MSQPIKTGSQISLWHCFCYKSVTHPKIKNLLLSTLINMRLSKQSAAVVTFFCRPAHKLASPLDQSTTKKKKTGFYKSYILFITIIIINKLSVSYILQIHYNFSSLNTVARSINELRHSYITSKLPSLSFLIKKKIPQSLSQNIFQDHDYKLCK